MSVELYCIVAAVPPTWTALVVKTPLVTYTSLSEYVWGVAVWVDAPTKYIFVAISVAPVVFLVSVELIALFCPIVILSPAIYLVSTALITLLVIDTFAPAV